MAQLYVAVMFRDTGVKTPTVPEWYIRQSVAGAAHEARKLRSVLVIPIRQLTSIVVYV